MAPGEMFGPYRLDALISHGSVAEVYRAFDTDQDRVVALMVLPGEVSEAASFRFRREGQVVARFNDPHVIPIHRHGEINGRLFIEMRLVDTVSLLEVLRIEESLPPTRAVDIVGQIAGTLDAAAAAGLIHGDIKPANVLLAGQGREFVYLQDFGGLIRRALVDHVGNADALGWLGSLTYMAPERSTGGPIDHRVDVYDQACLLYEMLTGRQPFASRDPMALLTAHLRLPPPQPSDLQPELRTFDEVVARGMAKDPARRYQSAGELAEAARAALAGHIPAPAEGWGVFISYRRADTRHVAARLSEKLAARFGDSRVFLDVESIQPGMNFHDAVGAAIRRSSVMLVLIGPDWITARHPDGRRRLDDDHDNVRLEIVEGLRHRLVLIPVLVDGAAMPIAAVLPDGIAPLAARNATRIDHSSFRRDDAAVVDLVAVQLNVSAHRGDL
ncbi:MAG: protein kinase [Pseudonocardia sp.]